MLRKIEVDGFRSLRNFSFEIRQGLNVLLGTNGAGKTTIVRLFEFISNICIFSASEAIGRSGGAGEVFDRATETARRGETQYLSITVFGDGPERPRNGKNRNHKKTIAYKYSANIFFDPQKGEVGFGSQEISIGLFSLTAKAIDHDKLSDLIIKSKGKEISVDLSESRDFLDFLGNRKIYFDEVINSQKDIFSEISLISQSYIFGYLFSRITIDLHAGRAFNIVPENVKRDEDISTQPIVNPDGSGLAATIFHLKKPQIEDEYRLNFYLNQFDMYEPDILPRIKSLLKLVNDDIIDIDVENRVIENRLQMRATLRGDGCEFIVPLRYLSDGTVKWLALVTAILSNRSIFVIEEPENFLHPRMLSEIVNLLRASCEKNKNNFALITTHSETLINLLRPEEIVLVDFKAGYTMTSAISDTKRLRQIMKKTGFGLGWFYTTGSLG
ncbi:AAA family ATPase [Prosthecodimorpha staleyi]|uniref:AAA family ATPase n=1 Tax=Prosthecodimorpha staleyi TaxID=2840188 RepID=A0A947GAI9_9HYPH|nr:AAA family ATPase [Prosthecodimorpha staleyi]MBT9289173.1 AAA family ATPase [Prosthecodimorpha staleyi]